MHTNVILLFITENDAIKQMEAASVAELNFKMRIQGHASGLCIWIFFRNLLLETS